MKHLTAILIAFACVMGAFASPIAIQDVKGEALGGIGMTSSDEDFSFYYNPASLVFRREGSPFSASFAYSDGLDRNAFSNGLPNAILSDPAGYANVRFSGRNAAVGISVSSRLFLDSYSDDGTYATYDVVNTADLQLAVAYGWEHIALGFSVNGGNSSQREGIRIRDSNTIGDYALQTLFERYSQVLGSEFLSLSAGCMGRLGDFTFGLTFGDMTWIAQGNEIKFSLAAMLATMNLGVRYSGSRYDSRTAGLVMVVPSFTLELHNAFLSALDKADYDAVLPAADVRERKSEICAGLELMLQLSSDFSVSFLSGFTSGGLDNRFFSGASHSIGLSARSKSMKGSFALVVPFSVYTGASSAVRISVGADFFL